MVDNGCPIRHDHRDDKKRSKGLRSTTVSIFVAVFS
jgi:hypothetical protein